MEKTTAEGLRAPQQVYRALERLVDHRLVHRIETLNAYLYCDHGPHAGEAAFAVCSRCGAVEELPLDNVMPQLRRSAKSRGFAIQVSHVELVGLCRRCQAGAADAPTGV
jgi:Fur family zinc uptake transcriptional regulator